MMKILLFLLQWWIADIFLKRALFASFGHTMYDYFRVAKISSFSME
jgi:hypothetical protein